MASNRISLEKWLPVNGWESLYMVSNHGRVKSLDRMRPHWRGGKQILKGRILKQILRKGYFEVNLSYNNNSIACSIARLVCTAFNENPDNLPVINHIDSNKLNNNSDNLEWCTISHNTKHAWDNNAFKGSRLYKHNRI